jgi:hypothetical protein
MRDLGEKNGIKNKWNIFKESREWNKESVGVCIENWIGKIEKTAFWIDKIPITAGDALNMGIVTFLGIQILKHHISVNADAGGILNSANQMPRKSNYKILASISSRMGTTCITPCERWVINAYEIKRKWTEINRFALCMMLDDKYLKET